MQFFRDIKSFFEYLTFVDIFFFIAIITLLILVVTLIYFIRINKDVLRDSSKGGSKMNNDDLESEILNYVSFKEQEEKPKEIDIEKADGANPDEYSDEDMPLLDLKSLTKKLEEEQNTESTITAYEKDQEEKAIISYDELLKKKNNYAINYEKEEVFDDLVVKKVNLNDLVNKNIIDNVPEVRVISYEKEEAFLKALKELNQLLN